MTDARKIYVLVGYYGLSTFYLRLTGITIVYFEKRNSVFKRMTVLVVLMGLTVLTVETVSAMRRPNRVNDGKMLRHL